MRATRTDERLNDFARRMDDGFKRVDADLRALRMETKSEISSLRTEVSADIGSLRTEMGALNRTLLQLGGGMIATFAVGFASLIATQL